MTDVEKVSTGSRERVALDLALHIAKANGQTKYKSEEAMLSLFLKCRKAVLGINVVKD